ncbi:hypothetical protein GCM10027088_67950 [Nocardia goodfellowii]
MYDRAGRVVSGSRDGSVRVGSAVVYKYGGPVSAVASSPDGRLLAMGSSDGTVLLIDPSGPKVVIAELQLGRSPVASIAFSPDGRRLAVSDETPTVTMWDISDRDQPRRFSLLGQATRVTALAFTPDGTRLVSVSAAPEAAILVWNTATLQPVRPRLAGAGGNEDGFVSVAVSPDGTVVATGTTAGEIRLWDLATPRQLQVLNGGASPILSIAYSPDGRFLAAGSADGSIVVWHVGSGEFSRADEFEASGKPESLAFDTGHLLAATTGGVIQTWAFA